MKYKKKSKSVDGFISIGIAERTMNEIVWLN